MVERSTLLSAESEFIVSVSAQTTHSRAATLALPSRSSSHGRAWGGITVYIHDQPFAGGVYSAASDDHLLGMRTAGNVHLLQRRDGKSHRAEASPGYLTLHPRGMDSRWSWDAPGSIIVMRIPHDIVLAAMNSYLRTVSPFAELTNCFGARDPVIERLALALAAETELPCHPAQQLVTDGLSCAIAAHLVYRFDARPSSLAAEVGALRPAVLRRVLEYMDANLGDPVTLGSLADLAGVTRFHFARAFRKSTKMSPMAYLEQSRLARARELLQSDDYTIAEIAALLGFTDQSHFTRRFRRFVGRTPNLYSREYRAKG
jgi:AraC family transcriptional regulator